MRAHFGTTADGRDVEAVTLSAGDLTVRLLTLGATLQDVRVAGVDHPLTLGATTVAPYETVLTYYGALVGPVANRIANATAPLGGETLHLEPNEGATSLHGGPHGMHTEIWDIEELSDSAVTFGLTLPDGTGGYPGNRRITARFEVHAPATLALDITGETDAPTLMNIANHSYWNLDGAATIAGHVLTIPADRYTPVDAVMIPTGVSPVDGTDFDFRLGRGIGPDTARIDHNLCLGDAPGPFRHACTLKGSEVSLRIETTEPGLQVYDGGEQGSGAHTGLAGVPYGAFCGVALEAQRWPDAPNNPDFPSVELRPGDTYRQSTRWIFTA